MNARIEHIEGHSSLGYRKTGHYQCECGEQFNFSLQDMTNRDAILALKDQWAAHRRNALTGGDTND